MFRTRFIDSMVQQALCPSPMDSIRGNPLLEFLTRKMSLDLLRVDVAHELPEYMRIIVTDLIQRYEAYSLATAGDVHWLVLAAMRIHWLEGNSAEDLLRPLHFYRILRQLVQSPAFKSRVDEVDHAPWVWDFSNQKEGCIRPYPPAGGYTALMLALHCGMEPAAQVLVGAGAAILENTSTGKSPLRVAREYAQSPHPRRWVMMDMREGNATSVSLPIPYHRDDNEVMWVSESTDKAMLEILLKTLRDSDVEFKAADHFPEPPSVWKRMSGKARNVCRWLLRPSCSFDADAFRQNSIYVLLVTTLSILSIFKVLRFEFGNYFLEASVLVSSTINIDKAPYIQTESLRPDPTLANQTHPDASTVLQQFIILTQDNRLVTHLSGSQHTCNFIATKKKIHELEEELWRSLAVGPDAFSASSCGPHSPSLDTVLELADRCCFLTPWATLLAAAV
ncbi:Uu.00g030420.m01.CDS01 [Anthostomella pinea]|uniref:Uu.00g030420.m01.CDS01 n=1 Tax=Anthostomella pinea TaxID=933095 RepID=A0AAI8YAK5_9PEZI|nr:Uu.00g030420.m01.CDS01 [Anthostomella pinea]